MRNVSRRLKIFSVVVFVSVLYCAILGMFFDHISSVPVLSTNAGGEEVSLPIIMYHSVLKDESRSGAYVITP